MHSNRSEARLPFPVEIYATIRRPGLFGRFWPAKAQLIDFSNKGLGFIASAPFSVGDTLFITFSFSVYELRDVPGQVRYSTAASEGWYKGGLKFNLSASEIHDLETLRFQISKIYRRLDADNA